MSVRAIGFAALCAVVCGLMAVAMLTNIVSLTTTSTSVVQGAPYMLRVTRQQHFSLFEICRETSTARVCPTSPGGSGSGTASSANTTTTSAPTTTVAACTPSTFAQTTEECTATVDDDCRKVYFRSAIIACVVTMIVAVLVGCGAACADCHSRLQASGAVALAAAALAVLVCQLVVGGVLLLTREKDCDGAETVDDADEVEYGPMPVLLLLAMCGTVLMFVVAAICPGRQPRSTDSVAKAPQRKRSTSKTAPRYAHQEPVSESDDSADSTTDEAPAADSKTAAGHTVVRAEPSSSYGAPPPQAVGVDTTYTSRQLEFEESSAQPHTATRRRTSTLEEDGDPPPENPITQSLPPAGGDGQRQQPERPQGFGPEWRWAGEHGLWWSDQEELYFDAATTHYCDPRSQMWFDPDASEWYDPRPGQPDAPDRSPRESRSATMSGSRPMPATEGSPSAADTHVQQQQQQRQMSFGTVIDVESVASTPAEHDQHDAQAPSSPVPSVDPEPTLPDGMDRGDWVWAGEWGLWWSPAEALYLDPATLFYFDPPSGQWYNSDTGEWFEPTADGDPRRLPEGPPESRPLPPTAALPTKGGGAEL